MSRTLGVDVGSVRVGLALSDPTGFLATPLKTLARHPDAKLWEQLTAAVSEWEVECVVIGLPKRLDGSEGDAAEAAREFGAVLAARISLPIEWWDERFTTKEAERQLIALGKRRDKRRGMIDSVAASILLQSWLDSRRRGVPQ